jgi:hypothetical protein
LSCPYLLRASTLFFVHPIRVDGRNKCGHDDICRTNTRTRTRKMPVSTLNPRGFACDARI